MLQLATVTILPVLILANIPLHRQYVTKLREYLVRYERSNDAFTFNGPSECYILETTTGNWSPLLRNYTQFIAIAKTVYEQICHDALVFGFTEEDWQLYGDILEQMDCRGKVIARVVYIVRQ